MDSTWFLTRFAVALLVGALIGLERQRKKLHEDEFGIGGIRTFILFALAGALSGWLALVLSSPWIFAAGFAGLAGLISVGYVMMVQVRPVSVGLTTEVAALVVFLLGGAAMLAELRHVAALAVVVSVVLASKNYSHDLIKRIGEEDLRAMLKLLVATCLMLFLPDEPLAFDPWHVLNPRKIWLLVVLISSISLVGYVAMRWLGAGRGTLVTGFAGGIVSSTAVTLEFSRRPVTNAGEGRLLAAGVMIAWAVMFARILIAVGLICPKLLQPLVGPFAAMGVASALFAAVFYRLGLRGGRHAGGEKPVAGLEIKNPFKLGTAIKFALLFTGIMLLVAIARDNFAGRGMLAIAGLAGMTDVDAIALSMADFAQSGGNLKLAAMAITIATLANTGLKCGFVVVSGGRGMKAPVLLGTLMIAAGGGAVLCLL